MTVGDVGHGTKLLALSLLLAAGCYPRVAAAPAALTDTSVTWAGTRWPSETPSTLAHGRELFLGNCNRCHGYPDLTANTDEHWPHTIERMGRKSHLDAASRQAVLHYVLAYRSDHAGR